MFTARLLSRALRKFTVLVVLAVAAALLPAALLAPAQAAAGDFSLNFVAAAPYSYDHLYGGGAFDDATKGKSADIVESLEAVDFTCGDKVTYLTQVAVDDTAQAGTDGPQTIEIDYEFLMDTTGASGAAIGDITGVKVNYAPVVDKITGEDTVDQGMVDDGGSVATLVSESQTGPMFVAGSRLKGTVRVTDLERAEKVIVRVDVRLFCKPGTRPTGNLQGSVAGARLTTIKGSVPVSPAASISVGNQTVPFLQFGNLRFPELAIAKTVTTATGTCPGTESLDIQSGATVKYCYRVTNPSTAAGGAALYDLTSVTDDNRTPSTTSDDFTVALTGLTDVDGDGQNDDLAAGGQASGERLVTIVTSTTGISTNTATVKGYTFPGDTSMPLTASDTASVNVTLIPVPGILLTKSVTDANGDGKASLGEVLTYTFTVKNTGNVPLSDIQVSDSRLWPGTQPCTDTSALAAGASRVCLTFTYTVTAADLLSPNLANTATGSGQPPTGSRVSDDDTATIPTESASTDADVSIKKTVDVSQAAPGDVVTYTLTVKNTGPGAAEDVVVTDNLPSGTTLVSATSPCTTAGGTVTCSLGTLAAGDTTIITIKVTVDPVASGGSDHQHAFDYTKVETHLSVFDSDTTGTVQCPTGYFATDGGVRLDSVDQGGSFADVYVLDSGVTADGNGWTATVRNDNGGQAQAKVNVVCMTRRTTSGEDHTHAVDVTGPVATTQALTAGHNEIDLACPTGSYPIQPSYVLSGGTASVGTRRTPSGWRFVVEADDATSGTFAIHCLSATLETTKGHSHELAFKELTDTVSVPPGEVVERKLTCPDGYKGIVAWADLDPGLVSLGNDPQPITRVFKFYNPTGSALDADFGLLCVSIRTKGGSDPNPNIVNTASLTSSSTDPTPGDHADSATFTVSTTGVVVAPRATVVTHAGKTQVKLGVRAYGKRTVTLRLVAAGRIGGTRLKAGSVLAQHRATLKKGKATVRLTARGAAEKALRSGKVDKAKLVVISHGRKSVRVIKLHR